MRRELREQLATEIQAALDLAVTFDHLPKELSGKSPICTIEVDGWDPNLTGDDTVPTEIMFIFGIWVRRDDPADAHDQIDALAEDLAAFLRKNYNGRFARASTSDYAVMDRLQYHIEWHFVTIYWW